MMPGHAQLATAAIALAFCGSAIAQESVALQCPLLKESSGVAASTRAADVIWTHNDSGDKPRLYAFGRDGTWLAVVELEGAKANDWEDMCSFERDGEHYLAIGDVGDNQRGRSSVVVYVIKEPALDSDRSSLQRISVADVQVLIAKYPSGPADCEGMAYDPLSDSFLLVTKEFIRCRLMKLPAQPDARNQPVVMQAGPVLALPLTTAADISRDGKLLVIATYGPACLLQRSENGAWDVSEKTMRTLALPARKQGESICFADNDSQLLLTSEFIPTPLWSVPIAKQ